MASNRNSTPEQGGSSLRPPSSRPLGANHHLRASADMSGGFPSPLSGRIRPSSEIFLNPPQITSQNAETEALDKAAREWINDLETYENTLEEMASAALDQEFKDELSAIEQWFRVLSEAERTAALYALLQQTTQVQIRFFIQVLQQMARSHPMSNILSPNTFEKDAMASRMNDAMNKLNMGSTRDSFSRPPPSPGAPPRNSGMDSNAQAMFPDAAAAIAAQRAMIAGQGGNGAAKSNRNSALFETRPSSSLTPSISGPNNGSKENPPPSPWNRPSNDSNNENSRPKSAAESMGNFQLPPPSAGLRSPRNPPPQITGNTNLQTTTLNAPSNGGMEMPQLSPYGDAPSGNWASMVNTPVAPMFPQSANADMVANATAMKLAALSTVNNRIILDNDPKGWGKRRITKPGNENNNNMNAAGNHGLNSPRNISMNSMSNLNPQNITMYNEHGQLVHIPAAAAAAALAQQQQQNGSPLLGGRSRPNSPGVFHSPAAQWGGMGFTSPQAGGFLAAQSPLLNSNLLGQFGGMPTEGYNSDDVNNRGRSPRGRRGSSKPPEDPTDPNLLNDIPTWLRSLRLHKYTDNLKDLKWQELVELDDDALEKRGVNALGARRKMLKVFEQVKEAKEEGKL
ncbi:hypothetical protein P167DRAFT_481106 [Morchella conica CCBAS932]|uniref:RNA-binding protein VTS1 n=1 Tax=Morchella conica CCBAS932 TaxID=1392247 RepID=A0A3N4L0M4_9PEZI|nr:hypothetical protein P167DRAFT_481106 [Morchella conica CCBAS932]